MKWFYVIDGQRVGPISQAEFDQLVRERKIVDDTLVWSEGMPDWASFASLAAVGATNSPVVHYADTDTETCAYSGEIFPKNQMIQFKGSWISLKHRDDYFRRLREEASSRNLNEYGGFFARLLAKLIDMFLTGLLSVMIYGAVAVSIFGSSKFMNPDAASLTVVKILLLHALSSVLGIGLALIYSIVSIRRWDATPGKLALGLRVYGADGGKLSSARICGRFFAEVLSSFFFMAGYIIAAFDDQRRTLHDRICSTRVLKV